MKKIIGIFLFLVVCGMHIYYEINVSMLGVYCIVTNIITGYLQGNTKAYIPIGLIVVFSLILPFLITLFFRNTSVFNTGALLLCIVYVGIFLNLLMLFIMGFFCILWDKGFVNYALIVLTTLSLVLFGTVKLLHYFVNNWGMVVCIIICACVSSALGEMIVFKKKDVNNYLLE